MSEVIVNVRELEEEIEPKMPDVEEFTLDDALSFMHGRICTILMNLLGIEYPLRTIIHEMYPYPSEDYIYDGMYVPIPKDEWDDPITPKMVDGRYPDDATQTPYIVLNGGVPRERSLSLWYMNHEGEFTPENVIMPHMMIHLSHNSRYHKMYSEFTYDRLMLNYLRSTGIYSDFRKKACKKIYYEYTDEMKQNERIFMMRPNLYCPREYRPSDVLTIGTVGHWTSIQGKKEFLNDMIETELAFTQYKMKSGQNERAYYNMLEEFAAKVNELNRLFTSGKRDHDKTFKDYRSYFNHEFRDPYQEEDPDTGTIEDKFYLPLYDFYEKFYVIYFENLIPDPPEDN